MARKVMYSGELTAAERSALIRFLLTIGDRAKMSTNCLLRPLTAEMLEKAFEEKENDFNSREKAYIESVKNFKPESVSEAMRSYFGKTPTAEEYGCYIAGLIKQESDCKKLIRKSYSVAVDYAYLSDENLAFHNSLSPRVTFGESNLLHEECDFLLTDDVKNRFLDSSLSNDVEDALDYGAFYLDDEISIAYEDLKIYKDGDLILDTVSHEGIMDVFMNRDDFKAFVNFENNSARNRKIAEKLLS